MRIVYEISEEEIKRAIAYWLIAHDTTGDLTEVLVLEKLCLLTNLGEERIVAKFELEATVE